MLDPRYCRLPGYSGRTWGNFWDSSRFNSFSRRVISNINQADGMVFITLHYSKIVLFKIYYEHSNLKNCLSMSHSKHDGELNKSTTHFPAFVQLVLCCAPTKNHTIANSARKWWRLRNPDRVCARHKFFNLPNIRCFLNK